MTNSKYQSSIVQRLFSGENITSQSIFSVELESLQGGCVGIFDPGQVSNCPTGLREQLNID